MDKPTPIGRRIRRLREESGLSVRELAALAGLAPSTLQRVEEGTHDEPVSRVARLAKALRVSVRSLTE